MSRSEDLGMHALVIRDEISPRISCPPGHLGCLQRAAGMISNKKDFPLY